MGDFKPDDGMKVDTMPPTGEMHVSHNEHRRDDSGSSSFISPMYGTEPKVEVNVDRIP